MVNCTSTRCRRLWFPSVIWSKINFPNPALRENSRLVVLPAKPDVVILPETKACTSHHDPTLRVPGACPALRPVRAVPFFSGQFSTQLQPPTLARARRPLRNPGALLRPGGYRPARRPLRLGRPFRPAAPPAGVRRHFPPKRFRAAPAPGRSHGRRYHRRRLDRAGGVRRSQVFSARRHAAGLPARQSVRLVRRRGPATDAFSFSGRARNRRQPRSGANDRSRPLGRLRPARPGSDPRTLPRSAAPTRRLLAGRPVRPVRPARPRRPRA